MFTPKEKKILKQLQENPGEVKFFKDIAVHFITLSQLEISTFSQLAYVNLSASQSNAENTTKALSEYFEVLVFIKKLKVRELVFHIPYIALENNTVKIGPEPENGVHKTIADTDLLIQLFQFAGKKYVFTPVLDIEEEIKPHSKILDYFRIALLFLLILFIGFVGYHAHLEREHLKAEQANIGELIEGNHGSITNLKDQLKTNRDLFYAELRDLNDKNSEIGNSIDALQGKFIEVRSSQQSQYYYLKLINKKIDSLVNEAGKNKE